MTREIRKDLNKAKRLYKAGKRQEAYEIYDKHFKENPDELKHWDKVRYCWTIYYLHIRDSLDEDELVKYTEIVTNIVKQDDLNESPVCVYTQCVFKVLMFYKKNGDWDYMLNWLDKINPELLNDEKSKSEDMNYPSKKEEFYSFKSKALLQCGEYDECIKVSKKALEIFSQFTLNGDTWHKFRIAKSLKELGEYKEALTYLEDVLEVQDEWYIFKEFAENYYYLDNYETALKYAGKGVLAQGYVNNKVNLYYLIYNLLKDSNNDLALKHAKLVLAIKLENDSEIPEEIDELNIDEENLDLKNLEQEIENYWAEKDFEYY